MKHPQIRAGRGGLPPTSNVPWSAAAEKQQRQDVVFYFLGMLAFIALCVPALIRHSWLIAMMLLACGSIFCFAFVELRRKLYAMLLNKPRSLEGLTQWTEHRWPYPSAVVDPDALRFFCRCGRLVDFTKAPFFQSSRRYSLVCECGCGHFMPVPENEKVCHFPSEVKR